MKVTTGLVQRFRNCGLQVVELGGWQDRGETDGPFSIRGVLLHHDGMGLPNNNVPEHMSQQGNNGAQLWIKRDGTVFILAAGRKWHAGSGPGWGAIPANAGNSCLLGIETDHAPGQVWTSALYRSIVQVTQCAVHEYGIDVDQWCCGHKEYAPGRKPDPENFDLDKWRADVKNGVPPVIPPTDDEDIFMGFTPEQFVEHVNYGVDRALSRPEVIEKIAKAVWALQLTSMVNNAVVDAAGLAAYTNLHANQILQILQQHMESQ